MDRMKVSEKKKEKGAKQKAKFFYAEPKGKLEKKFFSELSRGKLVGVRCKKCRKTSIPCPDFCPFCGAPLEESQIVEIGTTARVLSQTTVYIDTGNSPLPTPYSILALKFPRMESVLILPTKRTDIYIGDKVRIFVRKGAKSLIDIDIEKS